MSNNYSTVPPVALPVGPLIWQAGTGIGGYTLVNGTGTIISWTAPDDGVMHRASVSIMEYVSSAATGGTIQLISTGPNGVALPNINVLPPNQAVGWHFNDSLAPVVPSWVMISPGSTIYVTQASALTAGSVSLWAEIWGA